MTIKLTITELNNIYWSNASDRTHNKYGPSVTYNSTYNAWYFNGRRHRINGPAIESANGHTRWYIDGVEYAYLEYIIEVDRYNTNKENT